MRVIYISEYVCMCVYVCVYIYTHKKYGPCDQPLFLSMLFNHFNVDLNVFCGMYMLKDVAQTKMDKYGICKYEFWTKS